jgi:hypothetical protein
MDTYTALSMSPQEASLIEAVEKYLSNALAFFYIHVVFS